MKKALFALSSLLALAACGRLSDPAVCPAIFPASVHVAAQDSLTGANVTPGATVTLTDGEYTHTVVAQPIVSAVGVGENRAGTFTVTVSQAGYRTWTRTGVKVREGRCGAETVDLTARLQPAP